MLVTIIGVIIPRLISRDRQIIGVRLAAIFLTRAWYSVTVVIVSGYVSRHGSYVKLEAIQRWSVICHV